MLKSRCSGLPWPRLPLWLCVSLLAACSDAAPSDPADAGPPLDADAPMDADVTVPVTVSGLTVTQNPENPLSYFVTWATTPAVPTELQVRCDDGDDEPADDYDHTFTGAEVRTDHDVFVMGLVGNARCTFTAHPSALEVTGTAAQTVPAVGPAPADLPALSVDVVDASRMEPGWTLFSVADANAAATDAQVVAVDAQGRYRWVYLAGVSYSQPEAEVMPVDEGVLLGNLRADSGIVSWEGEVLFRVDTRCHHDLVVSPFGNRRVLFPSSRQTPCDAGGGIEHSVVELDMDTHTVRWDWWMCDHYTPRLAYEGWSHINAVVPVPGERAVLVSSRNQDLLLKVDRDTDEVLWTLGRDGDFTLDPADVFLRQHAPEIEADGTILLFDNGLRQQEATTEGLTAREYSRVLQLALSFDESGQPDRADVVWDYTDPSLFGTSRSEADRLPNGNTLIHYCYVWPDRRVVLREVSPSGEILWDVSTPPDTASYRAERFAPRYGYVR